MNEQENRQAQLKRKYEATHVRMNKAALRRVQTDEDRWEMHSPFKDSEVMSIVLDTGTHVWVAASYLHAASPWPEIVQVGDGRSNGYDHQGNCVLSVPAEWCIFLTQEEADSIAEIQNIEAAMLRNAR